MTLTASDGPEVVISGVAHTPFGKLEDETLESLIVTVVRGAVADAGLEPRDIDAVYLGHFNGGMHPLAFPAGLVLQADAGLHGTPVTRLENACASGSAAVHAGVTSVLAGTAQRVLVVGVEKMTHASPAVVGAALLGADYELAGKESKTGFAGLFATVARAYRDRYVDPSDPMAMIAAKNHANGAANPWAQLRKDLGYELCSTVSDRNPMVDEPLRRTDCSPISDGAAALVLERGGISMAPRARVTGLGLATDYMPIARKDLTRLGGVEASIQQAMTMAGISLDDLDLAEVHDCFTIAELMVYEAMGLTPLGEGRRALEEGWVHPGGRLPVNLSGGLKAKGHPVGATGVSQHVLVALQLSGTAPSLQLENARRGLVQNMGGVATANYATVLEAL